VPRFVGVRSAFPLITYRYEHFAGLTRSNKNRCSYSVSEKNFHAKPKLIGPGGLISGVVEMKEPETFGGDGFEDFSEQTREALLQQALARAENRAEIRRPVFLGATLFLPHGVQINCIALDVSLLGARIRVTRSEPLAKIMKVTIRGEVVRQPAHIIWRDRGDIGLEYLNPNLSKDALIDLLAKMDDCEASD